MVIMVATISGIFYYQYCKRQDYSPKEGTFVQNILNLKTEQKEIQNGEEAA